MVMIVRQTPNIPTLVGRIASKLERKGFSNTTDLMDIPEKTREQIKVLLTQQEELQKLASTDDQKEAYGLELWNRDFVSLHSIHDYPGSKLEGAALQAHIWRALPDSRFKRFQEAFADEFVVPSFQIQNGVVKFNAEVSNLSVKGCLVRPDGIPDKFLQDLKICDFEEEKDPIKRLHMKRDAILPLKREWDCTQQIQRGNNRLRFVGPMNLEIQNTHYHGLDRADRSIEGKILYTRASNNGGKENGNFLPRKEVVQVFPDVYAAHRKTAHQKESYTGEFVELVSMQHQLEDLIRRINIFWRDPEVQQSLKVEAQELLEKFSAELRRCTGREKAKASQLIASAVGLRDSLGRPNVSASMARMVGAVNGLGKRLQEMHGKGGFNTQDQTMLMQKILGHEATLQSFCMRLKECDTLISQKNLALFKGGGSWQNRHSQAVGIERRGQFDPKSLERIHVAPFVVYRQKLSDLSMKFHNTLVYPDRGAARDNIVKMHVIGKFASAHSCLERIKLKLVQPGVDLLSIQKDLQQLCGLLSAREIAPDVIVDEYQEPFKVLESEIQALMKEFEMVQHGDASSQERSTSLREHLDRFDLEQMVQVLSS